MIIFFFVKLIIWSTKYQKTVKKKKNGCHSALNHVLTLLNVSFVFF